MTVDDTRRRPTPHVRRVLRRSGDAGTGNAARGSTAPADARPGAVYFDLKGIEAWLVD